MTRLPNPPNSPPFSKSNFIIASAAVIAILYFGRGILIPLALAIVLSFLLMPLVGWLQRIHIRRVPSVLIVLAFCFAVTATIGWSVTSQLLQITGNIQDYRSNLEEKIHSLRSRNTGPIVQATATVQELNKELAVAPAAVADAKNKQANARPPRPISVQVATPPSNLLQDLRELLGPLAGPIETAALVIIFIAFMLINREDLRNRLIRLGGQGQLTVMTQALEDASERLSHYLMLQFLVNGCYGLLFGVGLYLIGIPHAMLWGALGRSPAIYSVHRHMDRRDPSNGDGSRRISRLEAMPTGIRLFAALELLAANVVEPWLYGSYTGISPLAILVAAVFWASLWGPVGLILSTPLTLCLILVGRYVPQMSFLEVLLGDAPALRPEELYYQRLLAMDQDEARNVARSYLEDKTVGELYESLLIPALRLSGGRSPYRRPWRSVQRIHLTDHARIHRRSEKHRDQKKKTRIEINRRTFSLQYTVALFAFPQGTRPMNWSA